MLTSATGAAAWEASRRADGGSSASYRNFAAFAAGLQHPVHFLIQPFGIAVRHAAHIVSHKEETQIKLLLLAFSFCLTLIRILIII